MTGKKSQMGEFCWNELMTPNPKEAKDFYKGLFGWEMLEHDMGGMTYTILKNSGKDIGGIIETPKDKENIPPHWMTYITIDNLDESVKKAKSLGATIIVPSSAAGDFGRFAIIQDPTGAHFALWQSLEA